MILKDVNSNNILNVHHIFLSASSFFLVCDDPVSSDLDPVSSELDPASSEDAGPSTVSQPIAAECTGDTIDPFVMDQLLGLDAEQQQKMSALFILGLKEGHCLSQSAIDDIISSCQDMFKHHNLRIRAGVQERLLNFGIDVPEIDSFLSSTSDPFIGLHSTYMQEKFYREKLGCIVSMHSPVSVFIYTTTLIIQETPLSTG